jgi:hypothetical protein
VERREDNRCPSLFLSFAPLTIGTGWREDLDRIESLADGPSPSSGQLPEAAVTSTRLLTRSAFLPIGNCTQVIEEEAAAIAASTLEGLARRIAVPTAVIVAPFAIAVGVVIWRSDRASDGYAPTNGRGA